METERVDIIIPVYNVEPYLRRCLNSIAEQTYRNWRAICIDDGSTDQCPVILDEYAAKDPRFVVVHQANGKLSYARNVGMDMADAEYIMFVDPDDFIHPQTLELTVKLIKRDGTDMVTWYKDYVYREVQLKLSNKYNIDTINSRPWLMPIRYKPWMIRSVVTQDALLHATDWRHPGIKHPIKHCYVWRQLFRRTIIKDIRFIEGLKYEDIPWWSEILLKPIKTTITQLPLYYYYYNKKSISKTIDPVDKLHHLLNALHHAQQLYVNNGNMKRLDIWSHNIKWAILTRSANDLRKINECGMPDSLVQQIADLAKEGLFDNAKTPIEIAAKETYYAVAKAQP